MNESKKHLIKYINSLSDLGLYMDCLIKKHTEEKNYQKTKEEYRKEVENRK